MKRKLVWLPLAQINPFDYHHTATQINGTGEYAFIVRGGKTAEHHEGARHAAKMIAEGQKLRPIAVCAMDRVPGPARTHKGWQPDRTKRWQRLDGFKRLMGTQLAGRDMILCEIHESYAPGCQDGMTMTVEDKEVGNIRHRLATDKIDPAKLPFAERISIEDCETVHVHLGNMRLEYNRKQFLQLADKVSEAAGTLRAKIANKE